MDHNICPVTESILTTRSVRPPIFNSRKFVLATRDEQELMTLVPVEDYAYLSELYDMELPYVQKLFETKLVKLSIREQKLRHKFVKAVNQYHKHDHMLIPPTPVSNRVATKAKVLQFPLGKVVPREFSIFQNSSISFSVADALSKYHEFLSNVFEFDVNDVPITFEDSFSDDYAEISIISDEDGIHVIDPIYALLRAEVTCSDQYEFELKRFLSKIEMEPLCGSVLSYWNFSHPNSEALFNIVYQDFTTKMMITPWTEVFEGFKLIILPQTLSDSISFKSDLLALHDTTARLNDFNFGPNLAPKAEFDRLTAIFDLIKQHRYLLEPDRPNLWFDSSFANFIDYEPVSRVEKALIQVNSYEEFKKFRDFANFFRVFLPIEAMFDGTLYDFIYHFRNLEVVKRTDHCTSYGFAIEFKNQRVLDMNRTIEDHMYYGLVAHLKRRIIQTLLSIDDLSLLSGATCMYTITDFADSAPVNLVVTRPFVSSNVTVHKLSGCFRIDWSRGGTSFVSRSGITNSFWFADIYQDIITTRGDLPNKKLFSCTIQTWDVMLRSSNLTYKPYSPYDYFSSLILKNQFFTSKSYSFHQLYSEVVIGRARLIPQKQHMYIMIGNSSNLHYFQIHQKLWVFQLVILTCFLVMFQCLK